MGRWEEGRGTGGEESLGDYDVSTAKCRLLEVSSTGPVVSLDEQQHSRCLSLSFISLQPPETGNYKVFLSCADGCDLLIRRVHEAGLDEKAEQVEVPVLRLRKWTRHQEWDRYGTCYGEKGRLKNAFSAGGDWGGRGFGGGGGLRAGGGGAGQVSLIFFGESVPTGPQNHYPISDQNIPKNFHI